MVDMQVQECIQTGSLLNLRLIVETDVEALSKQDEDGYCSIHWAATFDELEIFQYIVSKNPPLMHSYTNKGMNVLHLCVLQNSNRILKYLISTSCSTELDFQNKFGETPLHLAAAMGKTDLIGSLLDFKCNQSVVDKWGRTPVDVFLDNGYNAPGLFDDHYISKRELKESSAQSVSLNQNKSVINEFMNRLKSKPKGDVEQQVLVRHIFEDRVESITTEKVKPAPSSVTSQVASLSPSTVTRTAISKLLEYPGDPVRLTEMVHDTAKYDINGRDMFGWAALHKVCMWDKVDLLEILLTSRHLDGTMVSKNKDAFSALHCCVESSAHRCAEKLMSTESIAETLLTCVDGKGRTALQYAIESGNKQLIDLLTR